MARASAGITTRVRQYLWKKFTHSHGLFRIFWAMMLAGAVVVPVLGLDRAKELATQGLEQIRQRLNKTRLVRAALSGGQGPVRVYFTKPGQSPDDPSNIALRLANYIDHTERTLDVCAFEVDNRVITDALVRATKRGVRVRLVTETNYLNESGVFALKAAGVPVVDDHRDGALMHNKFMVFDNAAVWTGSMNFTENCAYRNNNHGVYFDDAKLAANYATKFSWMFEEHKFGSLPNRSARIPHPVVTLSDGTVVENYFSTHDHIANHVMETVDRAKQSIHFLAFSFTHDGIARSMVNRARARVEVEGVFEKSQASGGHTEYTRLRAFGPPVQVYLDANPRNMHHKVIVVDGETTVAGSFNFSDSADRQNDENVVIIHNREVSRQFEDEFHRVYADAQKTDLSVIHR